MHMQVLMVFINLCLTLAFPTDQFYIGSDPSVPSQPYIYNYQPESVYNYPNDINQPIFHQKLGMSPQYHNLVYNYIKDFAGTEPPAHVNTFQPSILHNRNQFPSEKIEDFGVDSGDAIASETDSKELTTENVNAFADKADKPGLNEYFIPSDFLSLANHPNSQFYGYFDAVNTKRMKFQSRPTTNPPLGGVISNYVLLRSHSNPQNLLPFPGLKEKEINQQHIKRQTPDDSDGVVVLAEPLQSPKNSEECTKQKDESENNQEEEQQMEPHPGIAQSKPSAIALVGPGGMAQASPVGTAVVGQGGLAVAAPSGTAVAGPAGQGPIHIGSEKQKTTEKTEDPE